MSDFRNDRFRRTARGGDDRRSTRPAAPSPARFQGSARVRPVWFVVIVDILVLGIAINLFALGNSSLFTPATGGSDLPLPSATIMGKPTPSPSIAPSHSAKASASHTPSSESTASATVQATATPTVDQGMCAKFADKFISGDAVTTDTSYQSKDINIKITITQANGLDTVVADIYLRNKDNFQAFFVNDKFGGIASTLDQAQSRNAILAINGDNAANRPNRLGYEIRNGKLYHAVAWQDVLVMYNDGSMKTFDKAGFDTEYKAIKANGGSNGGVWQTWTFGPMLLDASGQPMTQFAPDSIPKAGNERTAIGYYEPGHYCFVTVDSSDKSNRAGPSLADLSQKMYDLGCTAAYNMDGGRSSEMVFNGKFVNTPYLGGRSVSDIVGIGEFGN